MKLMRVVLIVVGLLILGNGHASEDCPLKAQVAADQWQVINNAYALGLPHDLGYSLAAIAWKESSAGRVLVNVQENSFGPFQILLRSAINRTDGGKLSSYQQNVLATKLLDITFSSSYAVMELEYWLDVHRGSWRNTYASYNGGWNWESSRPQAYASDIIHRIQQLKECFNGTY